MIFKKMLPVKIQCVFTALSEMAAVVVRKTSFKEAVVDWHDAEISV